MRKPRSRLMSERKGLLGALVELGVLRRRSDFAYALQLAMQKPDVLKMRIGSIVFRFLKTLGMTMTSSACFVLESFDDAFA